VPSTSATFGQGHLWQWQLPDGPLTLPPAPLTADDLTPVMLPLNDVHLTNPFALTFDPAGLPVVSDASGNGVATLNADGTTRFIHRFDQSDRSRPTPCCTLTPCQPASPASAMSIT
jgi:hypothetical protein